MAKPLMLLPFVHGIDIPALSCALSFAQETDATLLLVSLIRLSQGSKRRGIRPEAVAQAHDFFEVMAHKAERAGVATRRVQLSTQRVPRSIKALAQEMACAGVLLFVRDGTGVLLETSDIKQLLEQPAQPVYLFRLAPRKSLFSLAGAALARWFRPLLRWNPASF
ncbi:MAG: hypothetical protein J2P37_06710 [Ktedonobacteraceae bacterium]|nr:hypothetical protein [Ktedonobacteraceae bacterium]